MKNRVSIVVPVYNVERYLEFCLDSLLQQTVKPFEIILVDDGSTDSSGEICDTYAGKYEEILVIHKENEGLGLARNTGLDNITGDFVIFVDSDDFFSNKLIEVLVSKQLDTGADTVISGYIRVNQEGVPFGELRYDNDFYVDEDIMRVMLPRMVGSSPDKSNSIAMGATNVLYSMQIIIEHKLRFVSERVFISEDLIFNLNYYKYAKKVALVDQCEYNYRANPGSLSTRYLEERFKLIKDLYYEQTHLLKDMNIYEIAYLRLNRSFFNYLRFCFAQEKKSVSSHGIMEQYKRISEICTDSLVCSIIDNYPIEKLGLQQKMFLYFVRNNMSLILLLCIELRIKSIT